MKKELHLLIELQKIDNQFRELEISKGTLPQELARLEKEEQDLRVSRGALESRLTELGKEVTTCEKRDGELKNKIAHLQERLFATQTNQEYEAVTREIDWHQDQLSENELRMQQGMEQQEELQTDLGSSADRAAELEGMLGRMREQYGEQNAATADRAKELEVQREELVGQIPRQLLSHYERIRKAKDGRGVVSVYHGSSCGGCFQTLPPHRINQIRRMNEVTFCEICGRFLVSDLLEELESARG